MAGALVTVMMPLRHYHPVHLEKALSSILTQTSPRWRLLVIDDGADLDGRVEGLGDARVDVVASERPGLAAALNTGMRRATSDFVSVLFGDDVWSANAVEVLSEAIERSPEVDVFHASRMFIDERDRPISGVHRAEESFTLADFAEAPPVKHPMFWRRDRALVIGGMDESLGPTGIDDYDFPWSMAAAGARFKAMPECLYLVRDHRDSVRLTTHVPRSVQVRTLRRMMRKHGVGIVRRERHVRRARRTHLRACLYRSSADRWLKERLGVDPARGWRETYGESRYPPITAGRSARR